MITFDEFKKMDLVIAQIKEVNDHPNADKLYLLKIDTGSEEKQLVAGIRPFYQKEDLIGKKIVVINNLQPTTIRGEESQGMLLAACDVKGISLVVPEGDVNVGAKVH